mgnify:CR=1 FL=1
MVLKIRITFYSILFYSTELQSSLGTHPAPPSHKFSQSSKFRVARGRLATLNFCYSVANKADLATLRRLAPEEQTFSK